jgi:hypothetical protein
MRFTFLLFSMLFLASCTSLQNWSLRSASDIFRRAGDQLTRENSWEFFRDSSPGNLKFLEVLYLQDRDNTNLLGVLVKGFAGYAFAVPETLAFGDELAGVEESRWKKEAILFYTRAFDYGLDYLQKKNIDRKDLLTLDEKKLEQRFSKELSKKDYAPVLFTAQAWGSLINLQKDNVALVSQIPKVKLIFDWVCGKEPNIENGVCDIFYAQYEASRPRMLGGNPEKAEELFLKAIKARPHHLLMRVAYIQYMLIPGFEQDKYESISKDLKIEFDQWKDHNRDNLENVSAYKNDGEINIFNAIAKKRFDLIEKYKKKIF